MGRFTIKHVLGSQKYATALLNSKGAYFPPCQRTLVVNFTKDSFFTDLFRVWNNISLIQKYPKSFFLEPRFLQRWCFISIAKPINPLAAFTT